MMENTNTKPALRFPEFNEVWKKKKLGEVSNSIMYGMNSAAIPYDGENKYLRITDIDENTREFIPKPLVSPEGEIEEKYKLKYGDIVFTRTGASVGKTYLYKPKDGNLLFAGFLIKFYIFNGNPYFIFVQTLREEFNKWVLKMSMRSGQPGLNAEECKEFELSFPTLPEQTKIASFLTAVDEKIQVLKKKKNLLEQYKKGVMQKIFSQKLRFKIKNEDGKLVEPPKWEKKKLGEVCEIQGGYAFKSSLFNQGKTKVLRIGDINPNIELLKFEGVFSSEIPNNKYLVQKNDFVMALSGATFGKVGKIIDKGSAYINQRVALFRTNQCLEYYYQLVQTDDFKNYINSIPTASAQPNISNSDILNFEILIPCLSEQTLIANFLSAIDEKINQTSTQIEKTETWKKGLLQKMFV